MPHVVSQQYELVPVGNLKPHPKNPRVGNKGLIDESIAANGFYGAVIASRRSGFILAGKHRWERAQAAGISEIPVVWIDGLDETAELKIIAADNRSSDLASYDDEKLAAL